mmetsp:Transcript_102079/g.220349  ORF Transcript_102079/g.220349 Transcript_102079/m.220349 type:complete len:376 (-) Transcript_102079:79-1206(-)
MAGHRDVRQGVPRVAVALVALPRIRPVAGRVLWLGVLLVLRRGDVGAVRLVRLVILGLLRSVRRPAGTRSGRLALPLLVAHDELVGLRDLHELGLGLLGVLRVLVRVPLQRQLPVGLLHLGVRGVPGNAQELVGLVRLAVLVVLVRLSVVALPLAARPRAGAHDAGHELVELVVLRALVGGWQDHALDHLAHGRVGVVHGQEDLRPGDDEADLPDLSVGAERGGLGPAAPLLHHVGAGCGTGLHGGVHRGVAGRGALRQRARPREAHGDSQLEPEPPSLGGLLGVQGPVPVLRQLRGAPLHERERLAPRGGAGERVPRTLGGRSGHADVLVDLGAQRRPALRIAVAQRCPQAGSCSTPCRLQVAEDLPVHGRTEA